ncbi:enoyl-CoA hydratase/isomerase family protein, partial [Pseudomonadota bacterium]
GLNEVQVGLVVSPAIHEALVRTVGAHTAERMLVAGELMSSEKAHAIGLVDELVDQPDDTVARAVAWCEQHVALPGLAMLTTRAMARADLHALFSDSSQLGVENFVNTWFSDSTRKTLQGLVERLKNK